jgi:hypothetical protein
MATPLRANRAFFALPSGPPEAVTVQTLTYRLTKVFKHDFFAATCLYETAEATDIPKIVVKFSRQHGFLGWPVAWLGEYLSRREVNVYRKLKGVVGVPRFMGWVEQGGYAIQFIDGRPLDHPPAPPKGFFEELRTIFDAVHARGVAYCDANKRSNILIDQAGKPWLIDYQISIVRNDKLLPPISWIVDASFRQMCRKDLYHLYKHKRRMAPDELTAEEDALSRWRSGLHGLHRKLSKPYRTWRRKFLAMKYRKGQLQSPTAELEDHIQPEKDSWREDTDNAG